MGKRTAAIGILCCFAVLPQGRVPRKDLGCWTSYEEPDLAPISLIFEETQPSTAFIRRGTLLERHRIGGLKLLQNETVTFYHQAGEHTATPWLYACTHADKPPTLICSIEAGGVSQQRTFHARPCRR